MTLLNINNKIGIKLTTAVSVSKRANFARICLARRGKTIVFMKNFGRIALSLIYALLVADMR